MASRIALLDGHPDPDPARLCHALAAAYAEGAETAGREVRRIRLASLDLPLLRSADEFNHGDPPPAAKDAQEVIAWADHLVLIHPLWLGTLPAATKGALEQIFRPDFAMDSTGRWPKGRLTGRSARVTVTMGMPALAYRFWYGAHGLRNLERNVLGFVGFGPIRRTLLGMVDAADADRRAGWLETQRALGRAGR